MKGPITLGKIDLDAVNARRKTKPKQKLTYIPEERSVHGDVWALEDEYMDNLYKGN